MLTDEVKTLRQSGIGGSDIGTLWGLNPYAQPIDLFYDKRPDLIEEHGYQPREQTESFAIARGNALEDGVRDLMAERIGARIRQSHQFHRHPKFDWLVANIDGKVEGLRKVAEIKTVSHWLASHWGPDGTDEVAEYYLPQPHHYMLVLDYDSAAVGALLGLDELRIYELQRDPEMDELIIETTHDFWHNHVQKGIPPAIDPDHSAAAAVLARTYNLTSDEEVTLGADAAHWHEVMKQAKEQAKTYEAVAEGARLHLLALAKNAGKIHIPGVQGAYLRKNVHRKGFTVEEKDFVEFRYSPRSK